MTYHVGDRVTLKDDAVPCGFASYDGKRPKNKKVTDTAPADNPPSIEVDGWFWPSESVVPYDGPAKPGSRRSSAGTRVRETLRRLRSGRP